MAFVTRCVSIMITTLLASYHIINAVFSRAVGKEQGVVYVPTLAICAIIRQP